MQWLTAILALATTMFIFSVVVSTIVETLHRICASRTKGLEYMLDHFYDQVLKPQLATAKIAFNRSDFTKLMTEVRAPLSKPASNGTATGGKKPGPWSFKRLSYLPTETFMERLGASAFSEVLDQKSKAQGEQLLKDIAQKYESFGQESSQQFESRARLKTVIVALIVGWTFYVHPYDLTQTFLKDPEVAGKVAALADDSLEEYRELVKKAEELSNDANVDKNKLDEQINELREGVDAARSDVETLSQAGAPLGWPKKNVVEKVLFESTSFEVTLRAPTKWTDRFWLIMGGLLIGLGAPFWAQMIGSLTQAKNISKNIANILNPEEQSKSVAATGGTAARERPVTSEAFITARAAKAPANAPPLAPRAEDD